MSKLMRALRTRDTGIRYTESPVLEVKETWNDLPTIVFVPQLKEFSTEVALGVISVEQDTMRAERKARRILVEQLYGEFRPNFLKIREALLGRNFEKAYQELDNFYLEMYDEC